MTAAGSRFLALPDEAMPRTVFYDRLLAAIRTDERFFDDADQADVILPAEDVALETNWPRYGRPQTAFIRGTFDQAQYQNYAQRVVNLGRPTLLINMYPFVRLPRMLAAARHIAIADINLLEEDRAANPRTISMPAMPIQTASFDPAAKAILASFRGADTHPCRGEIAKLHDGSKFVCQLVGTAGYFGQLDASQGQTDTEYQSLLTSSLFAFVPRGDAQVSYRLLEVLSAGCIPIIVSDRWILPFDRTIDWASISLHVPENEVRRVPELLDSLDPARIGEMQAAAVETYRRHFQSMREIAVTLLDELGRLY